ncbi:MAG: IS3 family transposase, partial [Janthinobacterium lividum]
ERLACRVLGQHRSTQRRVSKTADDEAALTATITDLARQFGRYGYRRITALLRAEGWHTNHKRVERIWRAEGLKVPQRQPKRGRLWLNDGSCVRLRPDRPNHVWDYNFVEDRTRDGRKFRTLNVVDEFTREALAIRVGRQLKATDVIDVLADLFIARVTPAHIRSDKRAGLRSDRGERLDHERRCQDRVCRAWKPVGERLRGKLQRRVPRRAAVVRHLQHAGGSEGADRAVARALQHCSPEFLPRLPSTGTRGNRVYAAAASHRSWANRFNSTTMPHAPLTFVSDR